MQVTRYGSLEEAWAAAPKGRLLVGQSLLGERAAKSRGAVGRGKRDTGQALKDMQRLAPVGLRWAG